MITLIHTEIDVEVGHGDPLWIQETLEQQIVFQRIKVGDFQCIRYQ
ncbi:Uncharacterised protein [Vibrio cholerae]|nr:Uncharacterised protein [Vibrio cholerae]